MTDFFIRRPVFACVISLIILLIGLVGYDRLTVREYPYIEEPNVTITTMYPGASADIMESQVTKIIEDQLAGIEGIKALSSISREGTSRISVEFISTRDPDNAAADIRDKVSRVRGELPDEVEEPIIAKEEADSSPIMWLTLRSKRYNTAELSDIADRYIQDPLQTVSGVSEVRIFGERRYAMRIWLDTAKMAGYAITPEEVEQALRSHNLEVPSGRIEGRQREYSVLTHTDLQTEDDFNTMVISRRENQAGGVETLYLRDIGRARLGVADDAIEFRYRATPAVALGVVRQSVANPLSISKDINAMIPEIRKDIPKGVEFQVGYDSSQFIQASIDNVFKTLIEAVVLVVLVILLFLRSLRATFIPLLAIPVSLIGALAVMWVLGFSINTLTLLAMVLAIGLVVDDAIVVLENIYRHIEEGIPPMQAALQGSREIVFPVIVMTLTLAAVYIPVALMEGRTAQLFTEFALTLAAAVILSGVVALTLSPMVCAYLLKTPHQKTLRTATPFQRLGQVIERAMIVMEAGYMRSLHAVLKRPWWVALAMVLILVGVVTLAMQLKTELAPTEDRGTLYMSYRAPEGASAAYLAAYGKQLEEIVQQAPDLERFGIINGIAAGRLPVSNSGFSFVGFTDWAERERSTMEIATWLQPHVGQVAGLLTYVITPASLGGSPFSRPVEFVVKDNSSYKELSDNVDAFIEWLQKHNPSLVGLESDLRINTPQVEIRLNRALMAELGVTPQEAGRALELILAGRQITRYKDRGEQYDVIIQLEDKGKLEPKQLEQLYVRTTSGELVTLSTIATMHMEVTAQDLNRYNRMRSATITGNLAPGYSLGQALDYMSKAAREQLPASAMVDYKGQSLEYQRTSSGVLVTFALAMMFIYLVLAAQFESFIDPLIILVSVPLSMFGALLCLWLSGNTLNIYSQIGLITLIGLISKNGILIVEFAHQQRIAGMRRYEALLRSCQLRLRPVLMTALTMVFAAIPLIVSGGAGAESRAVLGWVIAGGMSLGTLLTLYIVPMVYLWFTRERIMQQATQPARVAHEQ